MSTELLQKEQPYVSTRESLTLARKVLLTEAKEIEALASNLDANFEAAISLILHCKGRVVVSGIGKSGHIGGKIAATLASTGTPAFFMHPAEASHGDLGMITGDDVVIALSNSGESDEILNILPTIKRLGAKVIAITGKKTSTLAKQSNIHLSAEVSQEACPLGLSPTASTTVALALGDALAVCVLDCRDFSAEDFAKSHPGGNLGRRLITRVSDVMRMEDAIPYVMDTALLSEALIEMTQKGLGFTAIVDQQHTLVGIFTDGDLRRIVDAKVDINNVTMADVMSPNPKTINGEILAAQALKIMEDDSITALIVEDENHSPIGVLHMHDILRAGVV